MVFGFFLTLNEAEFGHVIIFWEPWDLFRSQKCDKNEKVKAQEILNEATIKQQDFFETKNSFYFFDIS